MSAGADRPERPETPEAADSIARNTGFALGVKLVGALFTAVLTLFLVRFLGPEEYGVFALALGVGALVVIPSDLGISQSAARFIAEVGGDRAAVAAVISDAVRLKVVVSGGFSLALVALAGPIAAAYDAPELEWPIRILAVPIFGQSIVLLCGSVFESIRRVSLYMRVVAAESAVETAASIAIVLFGTGAAGAMAGRAAGYAFAAGFGLAVIARTVGTRIRSGRRGRGHMRRIAGYGSALVIVDGAFTLFSEIDVLLIGAILGVSSVGLFGAALKLTALLGYLGQAARTGVAPRLARGREGPDTRALESALRYLVLLQGVILAPVVVWAEPITELLLGPEYSESAGVLRGLAPFAFLLAVSPLLAGTVNYLGAARSRVPIAIAAVGVNAAIDIALLREIGIVAGAIGTDVAYGVYVAAHFWLCRRLVGLRLRPVAGALGRALLAAGAMAAVLAAFGTSEVALPLLALGGILGVAVYAGVLIGVGGVTRAELDRIRRGLQATLGRFRAARARSRAVRGRS